MSKKKRIVPLISEIIDVNVWNLNDVFKALNFNTPEKYVAEIIGKQIIIISKI